MRYFVQASLLAFLILLGGIIAPPAHAEWQVPPPPKNQPCTRAEVITHRWGHCGWIRMSRLILFVFGEAHVDRARCVGYRESHYYFYARNRYTGAAGIYQFLPAWWRGRWNPYSPVTNTLHAFAATRGGTYWAPWYPLGGC